MIASQDPARLFSGMYRLEHRGQPIRLATGSSAGGAAYYGWLHLLKNQYADSNLIVMAKLDQSRSGDGRSFVLDEVDGVSAKVEAILGVEEIDTIYVVGPRNHGEAMEKVRDMGRNGRIRVIDLSKKR